MINYFLKNMIDLVPYELSQAEMEEAQSIADSKYRTWEWNFAYGPEYTFNNSFEINKIHHSCRLYIKDGIIIECAIVGSDSMKFASKRLIGCRHMVEDLSEVFRKEGIFSGEKEIFKFF
jgi:lipoate-protein ligase A